MRNLSICIPTFNREAFLKWTLDKTIADFPEAKIIVSDNAKTSTLIPPSVRYLRQSENVGSFNNMRAALLAANTKYCMFLGDDDYLVKDEVQKGIDFLESHPEVSVYFAPCQLYNEVEQKADWPAFYVAEDKTFLRQDELWNFIMQNHVWPEHAIYRRAGLSEVMARRYRPYWCFTDLSQLLRKGPVHFAKTPFYRNITAHPVGPRSKLGDNQCLTDFDEYRAGLEILAYDLFKAGMTPELKVQINTGIRHFIYCRIEVAHRLLLAQNRVDEATLYLKRMEIMGY